MSFAALVYKELKELLMERTILIGIIVMPLILFPMLSFSANIGMSAATQTMQEMSILYIDEDGGEFSKLLQELLTSYGLRLRIINADGEPLSLMSQYDADTALLVPREFSEAIVAGKKGEVKLYAKTDEISISRLRQLSTLNRLLSLAGETLGRELAQKQGINYEFLRTPLEARSTIIIRGSIFEGSPELLSQVFFSIMFGVPMVVLLVTITAGTVAATSVGLEKEAKTLEILLTLPMSRMKILASKLVGSVIIAAIGAAAFTIGFSIYLGAFMNVGADAAMSAQAPSMAGLINITPSSVLLIGIILLLALLLTLGLGILAGTLAGDVRGGQQLSGLFTGPLIFFPFLILLFTDLEALPPTAQLALMADPFTHMLQALRAALSGDLTLVATSLAAMALFVVLILGVAAWLFSGERLVTMKIRLGKAAREPYT